ncbi:hypothetical protein J132_02520, partial [Termitomyces sp. J132]
ELYGSMRALQANKYWLVGCRKLVVETDAKYLKGMLCNPGVGPNAIIMRWIEDVLLYHFTLRHVPGKTLSIDDLSRRTKQLGDEEYQSANPELVDEPKSMNFELNTLIEIMVFQDGKRKEPLELQEKDTQTYIAHWKQSEGEDQDNLLPFVKTWLQNPGSEPTNLPECEPEKFKKFARQFFFDQKGQLYKHSSGAKHRLVVNIDHCMFMLHIML